MPWLMAGQQVIWNRKLEDHATVMALPATVVRLTTNKVTLDVTYGGKTHRVSVKPEYVEVMS